MKCSGKLGELTQKLTPPVLEAEMTTELYGEILLLAKDPKKGGKCCKYLVIGQHMVGLEGTLRGDKRKLYDMAGY